MKFFEGLAAFVKGSTPAIRRRYDVEGEVYRNRKDATPIFSYAFKGDFTLDLRHLLVGAATVAALCAKKQIKKKRKKKK